MDHYYRAAIERSLALSRDGGFDEALSTVDEAIAKATHEGEARWLRVMSRHAGVMADAAGQFERARRYYESAITQGEQDPWLMLGAALVCSKLDDGAAARTWFDRSYEIASETGDKKLSQLLLSKGFVRPQG